MGNQQRKPAGGRYPREVRERAVRMALETIEETGDKGAITRIAKQLGLNSETLRLWVRQAQIDMGQRPAPSPEDKERIRELERQVFELQRSNDILKAAAAFFARELDPPSPKS